MFGSTSTSKESDLDQDANVATSSPASSTTEASTPSATVGNSTTPSVLSEDMGGNEKRSGQSPARTSTDKPSTGDKKRRSSNGGVQSKASSFLATAKNSLHFSPNPNSGGHGKSNEQNAQTPLQKLGKQDPALSVPQGQHNNSAGESLPGPRSTFRVGVWEDKNKKCRRTMEDTHAFLYNFLSTPAPSIKSDKETTVTEESRKSTEETAGGHASQGSSSDMMETDNGYFAIFDGHAGTFAADWCGKKLHIILQDFIRKNPNTPIPEMFDQTYTNVDSQLEKLPLKNSGCTAVTAVLRWEDRIPNAQSATGSTAIAPATAAAVKAAEEASKTEEKATEGDASKTATQQPNSTSISTGEATHAKLKSTATRQRVLYTANVGDARIVLCRNGKALRLSYDHKGSDENEGKRVANAGGLILNNRVNGVLAVTRALGDAYMKDLVTGHPYTTETVIQPDLDEFIILACDGLWDVCSDQDAVDLVRNIQDPVVASKLLVDHALARFSTDNLSCMIVRFIKNSHLESSTPIGVDGDEMMGGTISETDKILGDAARKSKDGKSIGVSGSNSGKGIDQKQKGDGAEERSGTTSMEMVIEEDGEGEKVKAKTVKGS